MREIARELDVTKNAVAGFCWRRGLVRRARLDYVGPTTEDRLKAWEAQMAAINADYERAKADGTIYLVSERAAAEPREGAEAPDPT